MSESRNMNFSSVWGSFKNIKVIYMNNTFLMVLMLSLNYYSLVESVCRVARRLFVCIRLDSELSMRVGVVG